MSLQMPRPKKKSQIAKRLYAQRCANTEVPPLPLKKMAEAAPLPLKKSQAEVQPLPLKKMAEAAPLPLKKSQAEVQPHPLYKSAEVRSPPLNKRHRGHRSPLKTRGHRFPVLRGHRFPFTKEHRTLKSRGTIASSGGGYAGSFGRGSTASS